jgi:Leucine Rich repeat
MGTFCSAFLDRGHTSRVGVPPSIFDESGTTPQRREREAVALDADQIFLNSAHVEQHADGSSTPLPLLDLCVRCMSLYGIPPDDLPRQVVDKLLALLLKHHALRSDSLQLFAACEVTAVSLQHCRGVHDGWLAPLHSPDSCAAHVVELNLTDCRDLTDAGLAQLSAMPCLETAKLRNCHSLSGAAAAAAVAGSLQLRVFSAAHVRTLRDDAVRTLLALTQLQSLDLEGCELLTDAALGYMARMQSLVHLNLSQCHGLTAAGLARLQGLNALQTLNLGWCRGLAATAELPLPVLPRLSSLSIARSGIADAGLAALCSSSVPQLRELDLSQCAALTTAGLAAATTAAAAVGTTAAAAAGPLLQLHRLSVSRCPLVTRLPPGMLSLTALDISGSGVGQGELVAMASAHYQQQQQQQQQQYCHYSSDANAQQQPQLSQLTELNAAECRLGDAGARALSRLQRLQHLNVCDTGLTARGVAELARLGPSLLTLNLCFCAVNDGAVGVLCSGSSGASASSGSSGSSSSSGSGADCGCRALTALKLDAREVTDAALVHLLLLPALTALDLATASVTDNGLLRSVCQVCTMLNAAIICSVSMNSSCWCSKSAAYAAITCLSDCAIGSASSLRCVGALS